MASSWREHYREGVTQLLPGSSWALTLARGVGCSEVGRLEVEGAMQGKEPVRNLAFLSVDERLKLNRPQRGPPGAFVWGEFHEHGWESE